MVEGIDLKLYKLHKVSAHQEANVYLVRDARHKVKQREGVWSTRLRRVVRDRQQTSGREIRGGVELRGGHCC